MTAELKNCKVHGCAQTGPIFLDRSAVRKLPHHVIGNMICIHPGFLNKILVFIKFLVWRMWFGNPTDTRSVSMENIVTLKDFETGYEIIVDPHDVKGFGENATDPEMTNIFLRSEPQQFTVVDNTKDEVMA